MKPDEKTLYPDEQIFNGKRVSSVDDILAYGLLDHLKSAEWTKSLSLDSVRLLSPILNPEKIYCAAVNYFSHGREQNVKPPSEPYFFTKFRNSLIGPNDPILLNGSNNVDYEAELAVIIGKKGRDIPKSRAMEHVAGYSIANDVSFRDRQMIKSESSHFGMNWVKGKGQDSSFPLGPILVTADEIPDVYDCEITLSVNGTQRQRAKAGEMIFKIDAMIEYLSAGTTLKPGDIISTGTPEGVALFTGQPYLKDGDEVHASITGIGSLRNPVKKIA